MNKYVGYETNDEVVKDKELLESFFEGRKNSKKFKKLRKQYHECIDNYNKALVILHIEQSKRFDNEILCQIKDLKEERDFLINVFGDLFKEE